MNLVLIGVRGAGKSAVGAVLAGRLGLDFVDLDAEIERRAGRRIAAIFQSDGEAAFREIESRTLRALTDRKGCVLATGGGVVLSADNRALLEALGLVIWLRAEPEETLRRVANSGTRPPLTGLPPLEEAREIAGQRRRYYRELAGRVIDTGGRSVEEVCDELEQLWHTL